MQDPQRKAAAKRIIGQAKERGIRGLANFGLLPFHDPVRDTMVDAMHLAANTLGQLLDHLAGNIKDVCNRGREVLVRAEMELGLNDSVSCVMM